MLIHSCALLLYGENLVCSQCAQLFKCLKFHIEHYPRLGAQHSRPRSSQAGEEMLGIKSPMDGMVKTTTMIMDGMVVASPRVGTTMAGTIATSHPRAGITVAGVKIPLKHPRLSPQLSQLRARPTSPSRRLLPRGISGTVMDGTPSLLLIPNLQKMVGTMMPGSHQNLQKIAGIMMDGTLLIPNLQKMVGIMTAGILAGATTSLQATIRSLQRSPLAHPLVLVGLPTGQPAHPLVLQGLPTGQHETFLMKIGIPVPKLN